MDAANIDFFWGFNGDNNKIHMLNRYYIQASKHLGDIELFNKTLLNKQIGILITNRALVSKRVIGKYSSNLEDWSSKKATQQSCVSALNFAHL